MSEQRARRLLLVMAVMASLASLMLFQDRRVAIWPRPPHVPYVDPVDDGWLYRALGALSVPDDRLGIWGWAAQHWVYSGLVPANRESSTEFAWLNQRPDGYYRKRFVDGSLAERPTFFVQAVGPSQFMFSDRSTMGIDTIPALRQWIQSDYLRLLDDGKDELFMRKDLFAACCSVAGSHWVYEVEAEPSTSPRQVHVPGIPDHDWMLPLDRDTDGRIDALHLDLRETRSFSRVVLPIVSTTAPGPSGLVITTEAGSAASVQDCQRRLTVVSTGGFDICVIDLPPTRSVRITVAGALGAATPSIALGRPLLLTPRTGTTAP